MRLESEPDHRGPANFVKGLELYIKSLSVFSRETDPLGSVYR